MTRPLLHVLAGLALLGPALAQPQAIPPVPNASLEALASRLVSGDSRTRFLVGKLPPELSGVLPIPKGAQLYGSAVSSYETKVLLRIPASSSDPHSEYGKLERIYYHLLLEEGYTALEEGWREIFVQEGMPSETNYEFNTFCNEDADVSLRYYFNWTGSTFYDLSLEVREDAYGECDAEIYTAPENPLPTFILPQEVSIQSTSTGGGETYFDADVTVASGLPDGALLELMDTTFREAGWAFEEESRMRTHLARSYRLTNDAGQWHALLVMPRGGSFYRTLSVRADLELPWYEVPDYGY